MTTETSEESRSLYPWISCTETAPPVDSWIYLHFPSGRSEEMVVAHSTVIPDRLYLAGNERHGKVFEIDWRTGWWTRVLLGTEYSVAAAGVSFDSTVALLWENTELPSPYMVLRLYKMDVPGVVTLTATDCIRVPTPDWESDDCTLRLVHDADAAVIKIVLYDHRTQSVASVVAEVAIPDASPCSPDVPPALTNQQS